MPQGGGWVLAKGGSLHGSFSVVNGTAEVCFAGYDMFAYAVAHSDTFDHCPSNATYSSGFAASGTLSGGFGPGDIYYQTFVPSGWSSSQPQLTVVWTSTVEILPP